MAEEHDRIDEMTTRWADVRERLGAQGVWIRVLLAAVAALLVERGINLGGLY